MQTPSKSHRYTASRRALLCILAGFNVYLLIVREPSQVAVSGNDRPVFKARANEDRTTFFDKVIPIQPAIAAPMSKEQAIPIPPAVFDGLRLGGVNYFFDSNTCELTPAAVQALQLSETDAVAASLHLRDAAIRQAAIEQKNSVIQKDGDGWLIQVDPRANDEISRGQENLTRELGQLLPEEALDTVMQNFRVLLHTTSQGANREYTVRKNGEFITIQSPSLRMNTGLSTTLLKGSVSLAWIADAIGLK